MNPSCDFLSIFIRSCEQRTVDQAKKVALRCGASESNLFVLRDESLEMPSIDFLSQCFSHSKPWTLILEGDVFLFSNAIQKVSELVNTIDFDSTSAYTFRVFDKFFGIPAHSGNILVKTKGVKPQSLLQFIDEGNLVQEPAVIGIKCLEQCFWDIYRYCYYKGTEHLNISGELIKYYRKFFFVDDDFKVALKGMVDGISFESDIPEKQRLLSFMAKYHLHEKSQLPYEDILNVENLLNTLSLNNYLLAYLKTLKNHGAVKNGKP